MSHFFISHSASRELIIQAMRLNYVVLFWFLLLGFQGRSFGSSLQSTQLSVGFTNSVQDEVMAQELMLRRSTEREFAGEESHSYRVTLGEGQYMRVNIDQRGLDVVITLFSPDGKQIVEIDDKSGGQGQEKISQVAGAPGSYRLSVRPKQKASAAGRYEISLSELRAATGNDRALQQARDLYTRSRRLYREGKYNEAQRLADLALEIREKAVGPDNLDLVSILDHLAILNSVKSEYAKAEPLFQRALKIREKELGPDHIDVAYSFNNLALFYHMQGALTKAEPLFQRASAMFERELGPEDPTLAQSLNNLGVLYIDKGDYANAEQLFRRTLAIRQKILGPEHLDVAQSLGNLAIVHVEKADYTEAESLYLRALSIREKTQGPNHPELFNTLNNLAGTYRLRGDYKKAEPLLRRALDLYAKALGPNHPNVARALDSLAVFYTVTDDYSKAEPLFGQALEIRERALGSDHLETAGSLQSLAIFYSVKGEYSKAEPLYQRTLAIQEKMLGPEHPSVAVTLDNLAAARRIKGNYAEAETLHRRALGLREKIFGTDHPDVAQTLDNLATLYLARGDITQAVAFQSRAGAISERNIAHNLAAGSERQKLAYLATLSHEIDRTVSLHVRYAPDNSSACDLALSIILQRKGRVLDAMVDSMAALGSRLKPQDRLLLDQLKDVRAQLAKLVLAGPQGSTPPQHQSQVKSLEERAEELEAQISRLSAEFRSYSQPVTITSIQSLIPERAALIEFASYRPFNAKHEKPEEVFGEPRYVAYVLQRQGEPRWVDLGETAPINRAIEGWRKALSDPDRRDVDRLAQAVDERVMRPIRKHLGDAQQLLLSPDGDLNLIPFAALVNERGRYLVNDYALNYLTSGRDLLRLRTHLQSRSNPLIVADPAYGEKPAGEAGGSPAVPVRDAPLSKVYFGPLLTGSEARAIKRMLPESTVLLKRDATEAALKRARAPLLLHIATHGFFLDDLNTATANLRSFSVLRSAMSVLDPNSGDWVSRIENPLLRSGLALSGANRRNSGDEDGVLTALEAAGLDLWGTKLVVLSACDTGVGEVKNGEGVYGLRRAFVLAGSESQVMSLWKVGDGATRDLMIAYYTNLKQGRGRGQALRLVQMQMQRDPRRKHPYYWASFIQSGDWGNLQAGADAMVLRK